MAVDNKRFEDQVAFLRECQIELGKVSANLEAVGLSVPARQIRDIADKIGRQKYDLRDLLEGEAQAAKPFAE